MADVLNQNFGNWPRGADISLVLSAATSGGLTSGTPLLFTVVNEGTTAAVVSTTSVTLSGVTITVAVNSTESAQLANRWTAGLVKTTAGGREPLAAGSGAAFDVPGL